ncbi:hypothetical protein PG984_013546 [Apiospora sp. TS-2023a]
MLRSIVYQLIANDKNIYNAFVQRFRENRMTSREGDWQWHQGELKDFLRSSIRVPQSQPLLLLVDGFDEYHDIHGARTVVEFLEDLSISAFENGVTFQICLSSRHYPITMGKSLEVTVETNPGHKEDIYKYVRGKLKVDDSAMPGEIMKKVDRIFIWARLVIDQLNKAYDEGRVEATSNILQDTTRNRSRKLSELNRNIQWVLAAERPLTVDELITASIGTTLPTLDLTQRRLITSSNGLLEVSRDMSRVQFIHVSVWEFLLRERGLRTLDPTLGPEPIAAIHGRLWERCWHSISCIDTTLMDPHHLRLLRDQDPFLEYSATHILDHAEKALCNDVVRAEYIERRDDYPDTSLQASMKIKQWLREEDWWLPWLKRFLVAIESREHLEIQREVDAGLLYLSAAWHQEIVNILLEEGADVNAQEGSYGTALQAASRHGSYEIVRLLLQMGAAVNAQGRQGRSLDTALLAASSGGHNEVVRVLLEYGTNVNMRDINYVTALQMASWKGNYEIFRLLLRRGADVHARGGIFGTALEAARGRGHTEVVRLLMEEDSRAPWLPQLVPPAAAINA